MIQGTRQHIRIPFRMHTFKITVIRYFWQKQKYFISEKRMVTLQVFFMYGVFYDSQYHRS